MKEVLKKANRIAKTREVTFAKKSDIKSYKRAIRRKYLRLCIEESKAQLYRADLFKFKYKYVEKPNRLDGYLPDGGNEAPPIIVKPKK